MKIEETPKDENGSNVEIGRKYIFRGEIVEFISIDNRRGDLNMLMSGHFIPFDCAGELEEKGGEYDENTD